MQMISTKEELLNLLDEFIEEIKLHSGYRRVFHIMENPVVRLLSQITGYQPGYFAKPMNDGEYVVFDVEKIQEIRDVLNKVKEKN